jgi:hypothetical protein
MRHHGLILPSRRRFIRGAGLLGMGALLNSQLDAISQQPVLAQPMAQGPTPTVVSATATPAVASSNELKLSLGAPLPPYVCGDTLGMAWGLGSVGLDDNWIGLFPEGWWDYSRYWIKCPLGTSNSSGDADILLDTASYPGSWMLRLFNQPPSESAISRAQYGPFMIRTGLFVSPNPVPAGVVPTVSWRGLLNADATRHWIGCRRVGDTDWTTHGYWPPQDHGSGPATQNGDRLAYWNGSRPPTGLYDYQLFYDATPVNASTAQVYLT